MPICIAGMHRAGTSMVARLLEGCGVDLGGPANFAPPAPDNRDGYWEDLRFVALNDRILDRFQGAWDHPPILPRGWEASAAVEAFLARSEIMVERMTKRGIRSFDCREAVLRLTVGTDPVLVETCAILQVVLRHGTPAVRPDDVLAGLLEVATLPVTGPALLTRLAQGPLTTDTGTVEDPLARDRDANQATATGQADPHQTHTAEGDAAAPSVP